MCNTSFTYQVNGSQVNFTNTSTVWNQNMTTYTWNFGDNSANSNQINPSHTYANMGAYIVCLTISDSIHNCFDTFCDTVYTNVQGPCLSSFSYTVNGNQVTFSNSSVGSGTGALNYYWDFGGVGSSTAQNPTFTFPNSGTYNVCLYIWDAMCSDTVCQTVTVGGSQGPCKSIFTFTINGNQVTFNNSSTGSGAGNLNYYWWFGDGTSSNAQNPTHTYPNNGTFTVCLSIWDSICQDSVCQTFTLGQGSCKADFSFTVGANGLVTFTNTSTSGSGGNLAYYWTFGDGFTSTQQNPTHYYTNGTYIACLHISNMICRDSICKYVPVNISNGPCKADFTYSVGANGVVTFTNTSTSISGGYMSVWHFGDNNNSQSTQQHPTFTYSNGSYTVCLYIYDSICSDTICKTIVVSPLGVEEHSNLNEVSAYPNPLDASTTITYTIKNDANVVVSIVDVLGKTVAVLESQNKSAGKHNIIWNAENVNAGMYLLQIKADEKQITKKLIVK